MDKARDSKGRFVSSLRKKALLCLRPRKASRAPRFLGDFYGVSGRRIVDLGHLANQLVCNCCQTKIHLSDLVKETSRVGLCSILLFRCSNCKSEKTIYTSRAKVVGGKKYYSVNRKLALGILTSGQQQQKCWSFLAMLNIPPPSLKYGLTLLQREGPQLMNLAKNTCYKACLLEKEGEIDEENQPAFLTFKNKSYTEIAKELGVPVLEKGSLVTNTTKLPIAPLTRTAINRLAHAHKISVKRTLDYTQRVKNAKKPRLDSISEDPADKINYVVGQAAPINGAQVGQQAFFIKLAPVSQKSPFFEGALLGKAGLVGHGVPVGHRALVGKRAPADSPSEPLPSSAKPLSGHDNESNPASKEHSVKQRALPNILRRRLPLQAIDINKQFTSGTNKQTPDIAPVTATFIQPSTRKIRFSLNPVTGEMEKQEEEEDVPEVVKRAICQKKKRRGKTQNNPKDPTPKLVAADKITCNEIGLMLPQASTSQAQPSASSSTTQAQPLASSSTDFLPAPSHPGTETENAPFRTDDMTDIDAGADAGWQKRGCGKSYNSRSGHNTIIGQKTGLVLDYKVLQTACAKCSRTTNFDCGLPTCTKNYQGSAKSMEASSVVQLVCQSEILRKAGVKIRRLVTDEDATSHAAIKRVLRNDEVERLLDWPHSIRIFKRELYLNAVPDHIVNYFAKCAAAAILSNKEDAEGMKKDLKNLTQHAQGFHSGCRDWCKAKIEGAAYRHRNLKRDLNAQEIKGVLEPIDKLASKAEMLAPLCSTQRNESFNALMSQMAPKSCNFNMSKNIQYRAAAAVIQFNTGPRCAKLVLANDDHSPDRTGYWDTRQIQMSYQAKQRATREAKRQRSRLREKRSGRTARQERVEVDTYATGIASNEEQLLEFSQRGRPQKSYGGMPMSSSPKIKLHGCKLIFFDLETTGRSAQYSEILQVAATDGLQNFNSYALPKGRISADASRVNGFSVIGNQLQQMGKHVEAHKDIKTLIEEFMNYIESFGAPRAVLVSHNLMFDLSFLFEAVLKADLLPRLQSLIEGGLCTLSMARSAFKGKTDQPENKTVEKLSTYLLGDGFRFVAHDARGDAEAVCRFFPELLKITPAEGHTMELAYYGERRRKACLFSELAFLLKDNDKIKAPFLEVLVEHDLVKAKLQELKRSLSENDFVAHLKSALSKTRKGKLNFDAAARILYTNM